MLLYIPNAVVFLVRCPAMEFELFPQERFLLLCQLVPHSDCFSPRFVSESLGKKIFLARACSV